MTAAVIIREHHPYLDVSHLVVVEVTGGGEPLAADTALMRLLPTVDPPVRVERGRRGESLVADVAHVRPLPRVDADVSLEQRGPVESLAAVVTREHVLLPSPTGGARLLLSGRGGHRRVGRGRQQLPSRRRRRHLGGERFH